MRRELLSMVAWWAAGAGLPLLGMSVGPFGPLGQGGSIHGQEFRVGPGGHVYELDAFVWAQGRDWNGSAPGTSACLGRQGLPEGLGLEFASALTPDGGDVDLTYVLSNTGATAMAGLRFFVMLDTEIDQEANTFFQEYGQYGTASGTAGQGPLDGTADLWQIDEPGFQVGTVFSNLYAGTLSNSNAVPHSGPEDVALALGFMLGTLEPGKSTTVRVKISERGNVRGGLWLTQRDTAAASVTAVTLSGEADVPVPPETNRMTLSFRWGLDLGASQFVGTLRVGNPATNNVAYGPPFYLGMRASGDYAFANGQGYVDLTEAVMGQLGGGGRLRPGETVVVIDGLDVRSAQRSPPPVELFEVKATPLP